jgi:isoquinoline 1-oxidoreductase beta subunit
MRRGATSDARRASAGPSRRDFLKTAAAGSAGLVIGFYFPLHRLQAAAAAADGFAPNAFLRIAPDGTVTVICKHLEMGQGPYTGVATILADELDADWEKIRVESAPADAALYNNLLFGKVQGTGGSTAMANSWDQLQKAGAEARARLVAAASELWNVPESEIAVSKGIVKHASGKSAGFGELADRAQMVTLKAEPKPKDPSQWTYIGKGVARVDVPAKVDGKAIYTLDVTMPDMLTCVIARPPRFGAKVKSFDASDATKIKGVVEAVAVPQGVAVLAKGFWPAKRGADALKVEWDETGTEQRGSDELFAAYAERVKAPGTVARNDGDAEKALAGAARVIEAGYFFPFLAHAPMEANDCVIRRTADGAALSFGSQLQTVDQGAVAQVLGLKPEQVSIDTLFAGGSFGRRATPQGDMALEAAEVLKASKHGGPIKVVWTREDDIRGGRYRPLFVHRLRGGIDRDGTIVGWDQVVAGQSILEGSPFAGMIKNGVDPTMVEGASDLPYAVPNLRVSAHAEKVNVPVLWWRSVGHTHTAYSTETFLDELAEAAGIDPVDLRRRLLKDQPRHLGVLELVAEKSGWGSALPEGRARGIAVHKSFRSFVAQVAEVSRGKDGLPKVHRVVCAVDCGIAINPDVIRAQMESGIGFGLSAALYGSIDLEAGRVVQSNFDDYRVLRIDDMPAVEVHIVPSTEKPTGVGEPGVPPIAPAVANAWARLTGERVRRLPFTRRTA